MDFVPTQDLIVAQYATKVIRIEDFADQGVRGCLTINRSRRDGRQSPWALRILPEYVDEINTNFPQALIAMENTRNFGCLNGIALLKTRIKITTLGGRNRPRKLYRAIHGGQPGDGIKSRLGRGSDAVFFHHHLRRHLRWQSREASPFLSATNRLDKAVRIAAIYAAKGFPNVRIIAFNAQGHGWDHNVNRMWDPRRLARKLSPSDDKKYFDNEVLIEHSIPEDSIIATYEWKDHKSWLDPNGLHEADARAVQSARNEIKSLRQEAARKAREAKATEETEETDPKENTEAQEDVTRQDRESTNKRKAIENEEQKPSSVTRKPKRYKIGQKLTSNSNI